MAFGSFVLMLHSHLPFYRKAGMWPFGEENLYDCMADSYIPLLNALYELKEEGVKAKATIGITPILAEQLADPYLQEGFITYTQRLIEKVSQDVARYPDKTTPHSEHLHYLATYYQKHYEGLLDAFVNKYDRNLVQAFKVLQDEGCIEITTSSATHGFSPLLGTDESVNAQFKTGVEAYKRHFGRSPKGYWLPECAYRPAQEVKDPITGQVTVRPSIDAFLFENGLEYFFTEYHAIEGGISSGARRVVGIYGNIQYLPLPARPQTGLTTYEAYWMKDYPVAVMGRNDRASFQVWSAAHGYPGDGVYREFHKRDSNSGMKYWRLTSKDCELGDKMLYDPYLSFDKINENADHFADLVHNMMKERYEASGGEHQLVMVSFDTELYGHWWYEGVAWLKAVLKKLNQNPDVDVETGSQYLAAHPPTTAISIPESTWGQGGHYWVWQNHHTEWMWPIINAAEVRYGELIEQFKAVTPTTLQTRLLNQTLRELQLLQSSDWPFLVTTFQAKDYAIERFVEHKDRFWELEKMLASGEVDEAKLAELEERDNPYPAIDYKWYAYQNRVNAPAIV
jgi:1,4-alpha-glucan branching enzyme